MVLLSEGLEVYFGTRKGPVRRTCRFHHPTVGWRLLNMAGEVAFRMTDDGRLVEEGSPDGGEVYALDDLHEWAGWPTAADPTP